MATALDVANLFVDIASPDFEDDMTNMKVDKLVYFAQGWSEVVFGRPLFDEPIEAWEHGPVVRSVYDAFKDYGNRRIDKPSDSYNINVFSREQQLFLADVFLKYDRYTGSALRNMTHKLGTPWSKVYVAMQNNVITTETLQEYFSNQPPLPRFDMAKIAANTPSVGYRDANGVLVLSAEME